MRQESDSAGANFVVFSHFFSPQTPPGDPRRGHPGAGGEPPGRGVAPWAGPAPFSLPAPEARPHLTK